MQLRSKQLFFKDSSDLTEEGEEDVASAPPPAAAAAAGEDEVDDDLLHANAPLCAQRSHSDRDAQTPDGAPKGLRIRSVSILLVILTQTTRSCTPAYCRQLK